MKGRVGASSVLCSAHFLDGFVVWLSVIDHLLAPVCPNIPFNGLGDAIESSGMVVDGNQGDFRQGNFCP